jgi:hypothetical protein
MAVATSPSIVTKKIPVGHIPIRLLALKGFIAYKDLSLLLKIRNAPLWYMKEAINYISPIFKKETAKETTIFKSLTPNF